MGRRWREEVRNMQEEGKNLIEGNTKGKVKRKRERGTEVKLGFVRGRE